MHVEMFHSISKRRIFWIDFYGAEALHKKRACAPGMCSI